MTNATRAVRRGAIYLVLGALVVTGCSGEDAAESILENALENESGEDVDIDFDDGNISIETDEGTFKMNADGEGGFEIEGSGDDGEFSISGDDGQIEFETEDGSGTITTGGDVPDGFPEIPLPEGMTVVVSQQSDMPDGVAYVLALTAPGDFSAYVDELVAYFDASGYTQQSLTTTPDGAFFAYVSDERTIAGGATADDSTGGMSVNFTVGPSDM